MNASRCRIGPLFSLDSFSRSLRIKVATFIVDARPAPVIPYTLPLPGSQDSKTVSVPSRCACGFPGGRKSPCYTVVMTSTTDLTNVSDDQLLRRLSELVRDSRRVEAVLIAHIAEVDGRRIYIREAPSMFVYCTQVLHLSEHEAYVRITVARASRRHPELVAMLADGRLHLSGIAKLAPHLTDGNREGLLTRATHKTKSQIEELIADIAPKPDVAPAVRRLPVRNTAVSTGELGPDRVSAGQLFAPATTGPPPECRPQPSSPVCRAAAVTPLAPARYKIEFTASTDLRDKLARLQALMQHDLPTIIEAAVTEKLERLDAKRFGLTKSPRKDLDGTDTAPRSRYLPAAVRRTVRKRDGGQCTFVLRNGSRCPERRGIEFHHRDPFGRGGRHDPDNVCLMCRQHNGYVAELDYGKEQIDKHRRRGDRVSEGVCRYAPGVPPVTMRWAA